MNTLLSSNNTNTIQANQAVEVEVQSNPTPYSDSVTMNNDLAKYGETIGEFKPYDSQLPITDIRETRIVKCLYQISPKTGKKIAENSYIRVACKHLTEEMIVSRISELAPFMLSYLQSVEDKMIKEYHVAGLLRLTTGNLTLDKIIDKLEESEVSGRLNKEQIETWYSEAINDNLAVIFAGKMQIDENSSEQQLAKLELVLNAYKAKFASLASPKVYIAESDCLAMIEVVKQCKAENSLLGSRFIAKLGKMSEKQEDLLMSL